MWSFIVETQSWYLGTTNLGVKVSVSGRTSILFHKAHATMIWKQRAKLVTATARWALKHSVYGIVILRLGIYTNRPNVSKLCSPISSTNSSILISVIPENKLLASVPCFQKICLLFYEWFMLPNYNTSTFAVFLSFFPFCFIFIYSQNYTPMVS